jgi:hypothetical protein
MTLAFIIRPFAKKIDASGQEIDFEKVHRTLIKPVLDALTIKGGTTGEIVDAGNIREDMFALILEADLVVCDITVHNANVFYELGIRHSLRKKRTVLIKGKPTSDGTPFDLLTDRYLAYDIEHPAKSKADLKKTIVATLKSDRPTDSPIFQMLPTLLEADPNNVQVVPLDFREEVARARTANAVGWLRLLSNEVRGLRFQWEGLRLVATAQWDLRDYHGALENWKTFIVTYPHDITANLALANIYERLFRESRDPIQLEKSDQAIDRVFGNTTAKVNQQVEALALKGRNQKTRWRLEFDDLDSILERRKTAMNRKLIRSYEAYYDAFLRDLNHFYSGLNALQMGTILLDLSQKSNWYDAFESDSHADTYLKKLKQQVASLRTMIPIAISAGLRRLDAGDPERMWAEISKADMLFLTNAERERRVINAYRDAIPKEKPFAWDAARGQLDLFLTLGVQSDLARKIITKIDHRFPAQKPGKTKPVHIVVFAGNRVDEAGRDIVHFPERHEDRAREFIRDAFRELHDSRQETIVLASAAPGADILTHEICAELDLKSIMCLPMPADDYVHLLFKGLDNWRTRFFNLKKQHKILQLSDKKGLPRWLGRSEMNPWERGNQWVMNIAIAWKADRITLVVFWDQNSQGDAPGGTAQMVQLAEDAGNVYIKRIDWNQLLA